MEKEFKKDFLKEIEQKGFKVDVPYQPGGTGDQTTKEEFIKYVKKSFCNSENTKSHFDRFFDQELRGSAFASYRDWYPAMPACVSIIGNIIKIPETRNPYEILSVCVERTKEDLRISVCPIWHLHEGFVAIIENKEEIFKKGIKDIMFYFFDSAISLHHVHIHFDKVNDANITLTRLGIVSLYWQEFAQKGEMHIVLNKNTDFRNLFLW